MKAWILLEESGEYSDYRMGILGVFSDPDRAKQKLTEWRERQVQQLPQPRPDRYREPCELSLSEWEQHDDMWKSQTVGGKFSFEHMDFTIAPYDIDGEIE